jgi:hypothetical protein
MMKEVLLFSSRPWRPRFRARRVFFIALPETENKTASQANARPTTPADLDSPEPLNQSYIMFHRLDDSVHPAV